MLVEKPIATTLPDALRMRGAAMEADRKLMVGHVERFNPAVAKLRELVADGRLGGSLPRPRHPGRAAADADPGHRRGDRPRHPRPRHHAARPRPLDHQRSTPTAAASSAQLPGGPAHLPGPLQRARRRRTLGLLDVNWLTPEKKREIVLIGENGLLRASYITQDVWFVESPTAPLHWDGLSMLRGDGEGAAVRFSLAKAEPLQAELEAFCRCVLDDTPEPVCAHDGVKALAAALAVRESAAVRRPVELLAIPEPRPLEVVA